MDEHTAENDAARAGCAPSHDGHPCGVCDPAENDVPAWWLSWYHDPEDGPYEYHGPWWVSGYDMEGRIIVVAAVPAPTEDAAWDVIQSAYDNPPEDIDRRFIDPLRVEPWGSPESRFPRQDWMRWPDVIPPVRGD